MDAVTIQNILLTVVPIAFGLVIKYHAAFKAVPNALIPWVSFLAQLLTSLAAIGGGTTVHTSGYVSASFWSGTISFLTPVATAGWRAIANSLIYEVFLRNPVGSVLTKVE